MRDLFTDCNTVQDAVLKVGDILGSPEAQSSSPQFNESVRWRLKGIQRCLRGILDDASLADRGALIRELTRLADGQILLPIDGTGLRGNDLAQLRRFGVSAEGAASGYVKLLLTEVDGIPEEVKSVLRLDPHLRRYYEIGRASCRERV